MSAKKSPRAKILAIFVLLSLLLSSVPGSVLAVGDSPQPPSLPLLAEDPPTPPQQAEVDIALPSEPQQINTPAAPIIDAVETINQHNMEMVELSGSADATTTIHITVADIDGGEVTTTALSNGTFTAQLDLSSLKDGLLAFTAYAQNEDGQASSISNAVFAVKDTIAPTGDIVSPAPDSIINTNKPLVEYAVSEGTVVLKVDGAVIDKKSGDTLDELADGPHTIEAEATDDAGNGSIAISNFVIDTQAPVVTITSPLANSTTTDTTPRLAYTVSDGTVVVRVDGAVVNKPSGSDLETLAPGSHTVRVEATDAAGNTGAAQVVFTIAGPAPQVTISSPAHGSTTNDNTPLLSYTASEGAVEVRVDGAVVNKKSGDSLDLLTDGSHTVTVEATNLSGIKGLSQSTFTVNTQTPAVSSTYPAANATGAAVDTTITLTFSDTITASTAYDTIKLTTGSSQISINKSINGKALVIDPVGSLSNGTSYTVTIPVDAVKNIAGNGLATAYTFSFATQAALSTQPPLPPAGPQGLNIVTNKEMIHLKWDPSTETSVTGYNIYRRIKGTDNPAKLNTAPLTTTHYQDKSAQQSVTYVYYVTAIHQNGTESAKSVEVEAALAVVAAVKTPSDIPANAPYKSAVEKLIKKGVFSVTPDGKFYPNRNITRAEFAKATYFIMGGKLIKAPAKSSFKDLSAKHWSYQYIETLNSRNVMIGYPNKTFRADKEITRAEVAKVVATVQKLPEATSKLKDVSSSWAKKFINACAKAGVMTGYSDNTFKPDSTVSRAEAARVLGDTVK